MIAQRHHVVRLQGLSSHRISILLLWRKQVNCGFAEIDLLQEPLEGTSMSSPAWNAALFPQSLLFSANDTWYIVFLQHYIPLWTDIIPLSGGVS